MKKSSKILFKNNCISKENQMMQSLTKPGIASYRFNLSFRLCSVLDAFKV